MRGKDVQLQNVSVRFGAYTAVHPTDLHIQAGEFFSILGPSGCGKTTLLRLISGFLGPTGGAVLIGGENMAGVGPNRRPTALIFQNLALFPLMTVWENVAFGLEARGVAKSERKRRAEELLDLVALAGHGDKKPGALSGGQRQRVAVARALAVEPAVLLLDEPLSALDLKLRQHMRAELKAIQRKTGVTFIYITHDQGEALTLSDRIAVMRAGRLQQVGTTDEIYANPATPFVASFVGEQNAFTGAVAEAADGYAVVATAHGQLRGRNRDKLKAGEAAILFVRPERMRIANGAALDNRIIATVTRRDLEGAFVNLFLDSAGHELVVHLTNAGAAGRDLAGAHTVGFATDDAVVMRAGQLADD
ncbi:MAG: ABC transporter ATP-binding protein [Gammaproteobacteria bacterium]